jgi:hypothetical protein
MITNMFTYRTLQEMRRTKDGAEIEKEISVEIQMSCM